MDLVSLVRIMVRRWVVVVPIVLLTLVGAVLLGRAADPLYEATGSILVSPSPAIAHGSSFDGFNVDEIAAAVRQDDALDELQAADELVDYVIDDGGDGVIQVVATGASDVATEATADTVAALVVAELTAAQEEQGVDEASRVQPRVLEQAVAQDGTDEGGAEEFVATVGIVLEDNSFEVQNPYSATPPTGRLLQVAGMSAEGQERVINLASEITEFEINQEWQERAPILEIAAYGPSPEVAMQGFGAVTQVVSEILDERQARAGVPPRQRLVIDVLAAPGAAKDVSPPIDRSVAVAIALGLMAAGAAALVSESVSNHRHRRQAAELATADDPAHVLWPARMPNAEDTNIVQQRPAAGSRSSEQRR